MRLTLLSVVFALLLSGCQNVYYSPRFTHVGGEERPSLMLDQKTGKTCYARGANKDVYEIDGIDMCETLVEKY